jgi:hypothetical protein
MNIQNPFSSKEKSSKMLVWALTAIAALIIALFILKIGMFVGYEKARFSYKWGEQYHRNFGGPRGGFLNEFRGQDYTNGHGVSGSILSLGEDEIVIKGSDDLEKIVILSEETIVRQRRKTLTVSNLEVGDSVVIIGSPNDNGTIEAKMIRVFDVGAL